MDCNSVVKKINSGNENEIVEGIYLFFGWEVGLSEILNECQKLRDEKKTPSKENCLLQQYLDASPQCNELFLLWETLHGVLFWDSFC